MSEKDLKLDLSNEPSWCPRCQYPKGDGCCARAKEAERAEEEKRIAAEVYSLGGKKAYEEYTYESFDISLQPPALHDKYKQALAFVKDFDCESDNLLLFGGAGVGKSHLATIALRKYPPHYRNIVNGSDFTGALNQAKLNGNRQPFHGSKVLFLDDIEKAAVKEFGAAEVWKFFNQWMMDSRGGLIICSNLDLGQMAEKWGDDSIASRIASICTVFSLVGGDDIRLKQRGNK